MSLSRRDLDRFFMYGVPRELMHPDLDIYLRDGNVHMGTGIFGGAMPAFYARVAHSQYDLCTRMISLYIDDDVDIASEQWHVRVNIYIMRNLGVGIRDLVYDTIVKRGLDVPFATVEISGYISNGKVMHRVVPAHGDVTAQFAWYAYFGVLVARRFTISNLNPAEH